MQAELRSAVDWSRRTRPRCRDPLGPDGHRACGSVCGKPLPLPPAVSALEQAPQGVDARRLDVELAPEVLQSRLSAWRPVPSRAASGVLAKYARLVSDASHGAITTELAPGTAV